MSIDPASYSSFSDELTKIALLRPVGKALRNWTAKGWQYTGGEGAARSGWFGREGTWREKLPVGGKSLSVGILGATAVPEILPKEDPLGRERSRTERAVGSGAGAIGGLTGMGAALSIPTNRFKMTRAIGGAIGGGILAERLATRQFRKAKLQDQAPVIPYDQRQQLLMQAQGVNR
jgi:hypothetical protein